MPNHEQIYAEQATRYEAMISKQPDLLEVVKGICPVRGLDVVDMGAGTGRLTKLLAPDAKSIAALDASVAMLQLTAASLRQSGLVNWSVHTADHRTLPLEDNCADLVVSGWSICYLCATTHEEWRSNLAAVMNEIERILRPGGTVIIFETMGTGCETPSPPSFLVPYYEALQAEYGFQHSWQRTDYTFGSVEEAEEMTRFFFGDELADAVARRGEYVVAECAGVWWKTLE
ncbi:class I SAM-dependent methyltransferase [Paenibacillus chungangensis]|uniref:Class I SAM-dependent methyltransferase n=1 Tax=Paenibacillus chungangensis TaxID=696535 RepID=A0ABW3HQU8_9BACL